MEQGVNFDLPEGGAKAAVISGWISFIFGVVIATSWILFFSGILRGIGPFLFSEMMWFSLGAFAAGAISILLQIMHPKARRSSLLILSLFGICAAGITLVLWMGLGIVIGMSTGAAFHNGL